MQQSFRLLSCFDSKYSVMPTAKSVEHIPSCESFSPSCGQEILVLRLLRNPKGQLLFQKNLSLIYIPIQTNPIHILTSSLFKIHFNIISPLLCFPQDVRTFQDLGRYFLCSELRSSGLLRSEQL